MAYSPVSLNVVHEAKCSGAACGARFVIETDFSEPCTAPHAAPLRLASSNLISRETSHGSGEAFPRMLLHKQLLGVEYAAQPLVGIGQACADSVHISVGVFRSCHKPAGIGGHNFGNQSK